jgi:hypothetical protein
VTTHLKTTKNANGSNNTTVTMAMRHDQGD